MVYIKVVNDKIRSVHHMPFDEVHGLGLTEVELLADGCSLLVDNLPPRPDVSEGKETALQLNPLRWVEYFTELTRVQKLKQLVDNGTLTQEQMNDLLN